MLQPGSASSVTGRAVFFGCAVLCLIWGRTWLAIRFLVRDAPPLEAAGIRFLIAGLLLVGLAWVQKRKRPRGRRAWNGILVLSITIMAIPYGLLFWAEQYVTSSMAAVLFSALPLIVTLLPPVMLVRQAPPT